MKNPRTTKPVAALRVLGDPRAKAAVAGALALAPARKYPGWLRWTIISSPLVVGVGAFGYLAVKRESATEIGMRHGGPKTEDALEGQTPTTPSIGTSTAPVQQALIGVGVGAAYGTVVAGLNAVSLWADERIERGLCRLHVPWPRVVMGLGAAALTWRTARGAP